MFCEIFFFFRREGRRIENALAKKGQNKFEAPWVVVNKIPEEKKIRKKIR